MSFVIKKKPSYPLRQVRNESITVWDGDTFSAIIAQLPTGIDLSKVRLYTGSDGGYSYVDYDVEEDSDSYQTRLNKYTVDICAWHEWYRINETAIKEEQDRIKAKRKDTIRKQIEVKQKKLQKLMEKYNES